jgi:hypothetical protein
MENVYIDVGTENLNLCTPIEINSTMLIVIKRICRLSTYEINICSL